VTRRMQVYKCEICGNIVEVLHQGKGELVCCSQPMRLLEEKTADTTIEKHVPFIKKEGNEYVAIIGKNTLHPMENRHYIEWIEFIINGMVYRRHLNPDDAPEARFKITESGKIVAREMCNIHGLWVKKYKGGKNEEH